MRRECICAMPSWRRGPPWYDPVLINADDDKEAWKLPECGYFSPLHTMTAHTPAPTLIGILVKVKVPTLIQECGLYPKTLATPLLFILILLFAVLILFLCMDSLSYPQVLHLAIPWMLFRLIMLATMQITKCLKS